MKRCSSAGWTKAPSSKPSAPTSSSTISAAMPSRRAGTSRPGTSRSASPTNEALTHRPLMKIVKYTLFGLGGVLLLVVVVIAVLIATFDPNKYKSELARVVKEKTARTLSIDGKIALSFYPSVGVAVGKTSLSERNSDRNFARIDEMKVSLALVPLLSKQVVVDRVTLSGLDVELVKDKGGKTNFADLAGAGASSAPAKTPASKSAQAHAPM